MAHLMRMLVKLAKSFRLTQQPSLSSKYIHGFTSSAIRSLEDFKQPEGNQSSPASENIAKIRHQHYEEKRKAKLELIERTIRNGLLANLVVNYNTTPGQKSPLKMVSKTVLNSPGRAKSLRMAPLPARTLPLSPQIE